MGKILATQTIANSRTAFMAMKFGDSQLDQMVEACFKPAVKRAGFELKKLTDDQPAGLTPDQGLDLVRKIRDC